jgi:hypothetical protein
MKRRIRVCIQGVHMGLGHDGLAKLLKKKVELDVKKLAQNELVLLLNKHGDKLKVLGAEGRVFAYLKLPGQQRIMFDALQYIPLTFGSDGFDYDAAVAKALERRFESYPQAKGKQPSPAQAGLKAAS